jgi:hypothetical protein
MKKVVFGNDIGQYQAIRGTPKAVEKSGRQGNRQ